MNLPLFFTYLRILIIPLLVLCFYLPFAGSHLVTAFLFILAAFTDWLDGYLARRLGKTSRLGAFLDPVADKLIVATALVLIVHESLLPYIDISAAVIIGREIVISALREWMAEVGKRASVAVSYIGKVKTALQMLAIVLLLAGRPGDSWLHFPIIGFAGYILLYLAAILTLWSMVLYIKAAWRDLREGLTILP